MGPFRCVQAARLACSRVPVHADRLMRNGDGRCRGALSAPSRCALSTSRSPLAPATRCRRHAWTTTRTGVLPSFSSSSSSSSRSSSLAASVTCPWSVSPSPSPSPSQSSSPSPSLSLSLSLPLSLSLSLSLSPPQLSCIRMTRTRTHVSTCLPSTL